MPKTLLSLAALLCAANAAAAVFAPVFGDGMVVQAPELRFFGHTARPFDHVALAVDGSEVAAGRSDARGFWSLTVPGTAADPYDAAAGHTVAVSTKHGQQQTLRDVLFGSVVVCGGQREMAFRAAPSAAPAVAMRGLSVAAEPLAWRPLGPASAFSSVCYEVGLQAAEDLKAPIGLIDASFADSAIVDWVPPARILEPACLKTAGTARGKVFDRLDDLGLTGINAFGVAWLHDGEVAESHACIAAAAAESFKDRFLSSDLRGLRADQVIRVVAHRGQASAAPENTMYSQEIARRGGVEWIEDDTHPTKDKIPIVIHDDTLSRTTDGLGLVSSTTLEKFKTLDAGSWFAPAFAGAQVPTLYEQLQDLHDRGGNLVLEIKGGHSEEEMQRIHQDIQNTSMGKRVIIQSYTEKNLERSYAIDPTIPVALLSTILQWGSATDLVEKYNLSGFNPPESVNKHYDVVEAVHALGAFVYVYTPDTADEWKEYIDNGLDGIITNKGTELMGFIEGYKGTTAIKHHRSVAFAQSASTSEEKLSSALREVGVSFVPSSTMKRGTRDGTDPAYGLWAALRQNL